MTRTTLGIDLGSATIKLTLMEHTGKKAVILDQERLTRDRSASPEQVADAVRQAVDFMETAASRTILCLSSRGALFVPLSFPFTQPRKIREVLPFELESRMSVNMDAYLWDFLFLGGHRTSSSRILAAMFSRQILTDWLTAFQAAGIPIDRVELDVAPLAALTLDQADPQLDEETFLDIGWSKTNLACRKQGRIVALSSVSPGLRRLFPENCGQTGPENSPGREAIRSFDQRLNDLVHHIRLAVLAETGDTPKRLTVIGGGATAPELLEALRQGFGVDVEPLRQLPWEVRGPSEDPPLSALSAALCLQGDKGRSGFDLLPAEFASQRALPAWSRFSRPLAVSLGFILLTWLLALGSSIYLEHKSLSQLQDRLQTSFRSVAPEAPPDLRPMQYASVLRSRISSLKSGRTIEGVPPVKATRLLSLISQKVPDDTDFQTTLLSFDANGLRINGLAGDFKVVDSLQSALSDLDIFSNVEIIGANVDARDEGVTFSLRLELS